MAKARDDKQAIALAEYKFGLIAPTFNDTYPDASMAAYFRRIAQNPLELPDGSRVRVNPSTLASWRRRYKELGFEALLPKQRSDLGRSRRIDDDLARDIQQMRLENPKMGAQLVLDELVSQGYVAKGEMSVATMQRFFRRHPVEGVEKDVKDRRAFESARVNGIWQADTLYGPYVGSPPKRAYLQAIIDDKSRKVVSARFVDSDCAATFQGTLKRAVASHGIPEKLFVDNGGPYANEQLSLICGTLGIVLIHAAVRDGASKGKIERWNRTLRMRFLSKLPDEAKESLDALNAHLAKWVNAYNATVHSSTKAIPSEVFASEADRVRWHPDGQDGLTEAFRNLIRRKVAKDATVRVECVLYDTPMGLIGEKVELRYTPGRTDDVWLVAPDGTRTRIQPTDKARNADAKRKKPTYSIDYLNDTEA